LKSNGKPETPNQVKMIGPKSIGMRTTLKSALNGEDLAALLSPKTDKTDTMR